MNNAKICKKLSCHAVFLIATNHPNFMDYSAKKQKLIENIHKSWQLMIEELLKIPKDRWEEPGVINKWSIKDILAHIHEWHNILQIWQKEAGEGIQPAIPSPGFKWNQLRQLNDEIYKKYKDVEVEEVYQKMLNSHDQLVEYVTTIPAEALFKRGYYKWTGQQYLKSYIIPNSTGHYRWARKYIRQWRQSMKQVQPIR